MSCIGTQDRSLLRLSRVLRLEILQECIVCVRPTLLVQWTLLVHCISVVCIPPKPDLFIQVALQLFMVIRVSWTKLVHIFCSCTWTSMHRRSHITLVSFSALFSARTSDVWTPIFTSSSCCLLHSSLIFFTLVRIFLSSNQSWYPLNTRSSEDFIVIAASALANLLSLYIRSKLSR